MKTIIISAALFLVSIFGFAACYIGKPNEKEMKNDLFKNKKILVAYFSRAGENYAVGNITKGNTQIVAEIIAQETGADLFEISPVKSYPHRYDSCTVMAELEKKNNARPAIKENKSIDNYDIIFIGYPIWWGDAPMPVYTWIEKNQWKGKTVIPFCTHEGSALGSTEELIGNACKGALMEQGIAIQGRTAQHKKTEALKQIQAWLYKLKKEAY